MQLLILNYRLTTGTAGKRRGAGRNVQEWEYKQLWVIPPHKVYMLVNYNHTLKNTAIGSTI